MNQLNFFSKNLSVKLIIILIFCISVTFVGLTGCDDDNSTGAKLFDARQALDDGNWELAKEILESLPESEESLQYLSNSYAGDVGIDTFNFLTTIDNMDKNGSDSGSIDMIGELIGAENGNLSCADAHTKLADINTAIEKMNKLAEFLNIDVSSLNDDYKVQLALASITRTVLIIADLICDQLGGSATISMTEAWLKAHEDLTLAPTQEQLDMITEDLTNITYAIDVLDQGNDILDDFQSYKAELDQNGDGSVSSDELNTYIDSF